MLRNLSLLAALLTLNSLADAGIRTKAAPGISIPALPASVGTLGGTLGGLPSIQALQTPSLGLQRVAESPLKSVPSAPSENQAVHSVTRFVPVQLAIQQDDRGSAPSAHLIGSLGSFFENSAPGPKWRDHSGSGRLRRDERSGLDPPTTKAERRAARRAQVHAAEQRLTRAQPVKRGLADIPQLRIGSYNILNLFQMVGEWVPDFNRPGKRKQVAPPNFKRQDQLEGSAQAILESDLDIVVLQEVEDIKALRVFSDRFLGGLYEAMLIEGNDGRGIDVGFLVKKDLPLKFEVFTNKDEVWDDPIFGAGKKLFSRDLPALVASTEEGAPLFVLLGTHYKSKRTRDPRDPESEGLRRAQVERTAEIALRYMKRYGAVPIMLAGDFNGEPNQERTFVALKRFAKMTDSLDQLQPPLPYLKRVTHTYHPNGKPAEKRQIDAIFILAAFAALILGAWVYRYKDKQGRELPLPDSFKQREKNPSDHFPVIALLDFKALLKLLGL